MYYSLFDKRKKNWLYADVINFKINAFPFLPQFSIHFQRYDILLSIKVFNVPLLFIEWSIIIHSHFMENPFNFFFIWKTKYIFSWCSRLSVTYQIYNILYGIMCMCIPHALNVYGHIMCIEVLEVKNKRKILFLFGGDDAFLFL